MAQNSLVTRQAVLDGPVLIPSPEEVTLSNFAIIFNNDVVMYFFNTTVVTIGTIVSVCILSLIAGYGLARFEWSQKENFARFLLFGYMFSPIVLWTSIISDLAKSWTFEHACWTHYFSNSDLNAILSMADVEVHSDYTTVNGRISMGCWSFTLAGLQRRCCSTNQAVYHCGCIIRLRNRME